MKIKLIVGVASLALLGLTGCDSNDRNRDYNTTTSRDASMDSTATSTGAGGQRGYYVPETRDNMRNTNTYNNNRTNMGSNSYGGTNTTNPNSNYNDANTRNRGTSNSGMGMVDEKAKDGCCGGSCGEKH